MPKDVNPSRQIKLLFRKKMSFPADLGDAGDDW